MSAEVSPLRHSLRRRITIVLVAVVVAIIAFFCIWIGVRGSIARSELLGAVPLARTIEAAAVAGHVSTTAADVNALQKKSANAEALTSDPIWRLVEHVPGVGPNLTAVRQSAALVHEVATSGIPPLITLAKTVNVHQLVPHDGTIDLSVFSRATPSLAVAKAALDVAKKHASVIDSDATVAPVQSAVRKLVGLVDKTAETVDGVDVAARLLPGMLGADGPRDYLLLSLNSAELRTPGGIPGAIAVVHADNGRISLGERTSATALHRAAAPVLPLTKPEQVLYDKRLGLYMQDVVSTPNFERGGELARAMWKVKTGETVDGIVAIDPIALSYILKATGPVSIGSGVVLNSKNAPTFLLSTVYAMIPDQLKQDDFFAGATGDIFDVLTKGKLNSGTLLNALAKSASQDRIHIWSADPSEEKVLSTSTLAGALPRSTKKTTAFGVYLNDATGAKMDFYLRNSIHISSGVCRADKRPDYSVSVKLTLDAPLDAASSLTGYVLGNDAFGVKLGNVRTNVYVYAPPGAEPYSVKVNGKEFAFVSATLDGHPVAGASVEMGPQQSRNVVFQFLGKAGAPQKITLQHTPMSSPVATSISGKVDCNRL